MTRSVPLPAAFLLVALAFPPVARAQPINGLYVSGAGGVSLPAGRTEDKSAPNLSLDPGPTGAAAVGYGFGNGFRTELEGTYRSNPLTARAPGPGPAAGTFGGQPPH
jgi:hypothetical protein